MTQMNRMNTEKLNNVNGGFHDGQWMTVHGLLPADYLIVRTDPDDDPAHEIGGLCNGDEVRIAGKPVPGTEFGAPATFVNVYVAKFGRFGYVNLDFIW